MDLAKYFAGGQTADSGTDDAKIALGSKCPLGCRLSHLIFGVGLAATLWATWDVKTGVDQSLSSHFELICNELTGKIQDRLSSHEQILRSCAAFYEQKNNVNRLEWRYFTDRLNTNRRGFGIQNLGFSLVVPQDQLAEHQKKIRAEGFPDYRVWPADDRPFFTSIIYLEPFRDRNLRAFGYDMFSEPVRRAAMEKARDLDMAVLSGKVTLVQETNQDIQAGALMYVPAYQTDLPHNTVAERRAALIGWAYSPYRMNDLLSGILGEWDWAYHSKIHLQIYDGAAVTPDALLFDSLSVAGLKDTQNHTKFLLDRQLLLNGRSWILRFSCPSLGFFSEEYSKVWFVLLGGILVSLLLSRLFASQADTRRRAQQLADRLTADLQRAKTRLELATRAGGVGIWDYDVKSEKIIWDDQMFLLYGISREEFDSSFNDKFDRIHPDDRERCRQMVQKALTGERELDLEYRIFRPDGSIRHLRAMASVLRNPAGEAEHMIGTTWDMTESKLNEEALSRQRTLLSNLLDSIPDLIFFKDLNGVYLGCNPQFARLVDKDRKEIIGHSDYDLFGEKVAREFRKFDRIAIESGQISHNEEWISYRDGRQVLVDTIKAPLKTPDGQILGLLGVSRDITYRKDAEDQLKKSRWRLKSVIDATRLGIWEWNVITDETIYDEMWAQIIGYTLTELAPVNLDTWVKVVHPDDFPRVNGLLQQLIRGEITDFECECRLKHKDGHWVWINDRGSVFVRDEGGKPQVLVGSHQDISERKLAESLQAYNRDFERLVTSLANRFINVSFESIDRVIEEMLQNIGEFVHADRSYIFEFYDNLQMMSNTFEWCAPGIDPQIKSVQQMPTKELPWLMKKVTDHPLIIPDVSQLPDEAAAERRILEDQSIKSLVLIPLIADTVPLGFIGFDAVSEYRNWPAETVAVLKIAAGIVTSVLLRRRGEQLIQKELDLALKLNASRSLDEILAICLNAALDISGMDCGGIYLVDAEHCKIRLVQHAGLPEEFVQAVSVYGPEDIHYQLVMKGEAVYSVQSQMPSPIAERLARQKIRKIAILPVMYQGTVVACLNVASHVLTQIPEFSRKALESVLPHIGFAIVHARYEEEINMANKNLQSLFDTIDDLMFIIDLNGVILHTNLVAQYRLGYAADELAGMPVINIHPPDRRDEVETIIRNMIAKKQNTCMVPLLTKDGEEIPSETVITFGHWNDVPVLFGICRDISERLRSEAALRESALQKRVSENLRSIIDNIPGTVYRIAADGCISFFSPVRKTADAATPVKIPPVHPDDWQMVNQAQKQLRVSQCSLVLTYRVLNEDRQVRYVEDRCCSIFDDDGKFLGIDGIRLDITDRVRAEEEKAALETGIRQRQRLETIGTLAGGIAHDFNNILVPVLGYAEMGADEVPADQPPHEYFTEIIHAAERAKNLVSQILMFSRPGESDPKPVSLQQLLKETFQLLRPSIPANILIKMRVDDHCRNTLADPSQIHQVIVNLCTNAFHAMEQKGGNGVLSIELAEVKDRRDCPAGCDHSRNYLMLRVTDSGIGMDEATIEHIYEPFFTTKPVNKGTGLGLPVVYGIVKSCKGEITVESRPGEGTTFKVFLPVIDSPVEDNRPAVKPSTGKGRVLLVDDEPSAVKVISALLAKLGYEIVGKTSAIEALTAVTQTPAAFDVVITDLTMPGMSGVELAQKIHGLRPDLPVILLTGYGKNIDQPAILENCGIRQVLKKPVKLEILAAAVSGIIGQ